MQNSQLENAIKVFEDFLYLDLEKTDFAPLIVNHPIIESAFLSDENGMFDVTEDKERWDKYRKAYMKMIRKNETSIDGLICHVRKPYRMAYLKFLLQGKVLSQKEVSNLLAKIWTTLENVSHDINVKKHIVLSWIKKAEKDVLMDEEDRSVYDSLDDVVTIYRGARDEKGFDGLSWTIDKATAEWFARRFYGEGYVLEAVIDKKDIVAYINSRDEKEVIVDYKKIRDVKKYEVS